MAARKNAVTAQQEPTTTPDAQLVAFQEHSQAITKTYLEGQPYDRLRVVNEARWHMQQSAEAMLEAGKRLIVLKEHEPHGEFIEIVEAQLGLHGRAAQRMMSAALKFLSPKLASKATALSHLGKTKLFELVAEDDDDLAALADGGTVAGLTLDDVDRMTTRELKAALRDARADAEAKDEVVAAKNTKIDKLTADAKLIKKLPPDERDQQFRTEIIDQVFLCEAQIRNQVRQGLADALAHAADNGISLDAFAQGQLSQLEDALADVRTALGVFRTQTPEWGNDGAQGDQA